MGREKKEKEKDDQPIAPVSIILFIFHTNEDKNLNDHSVECFLVHILASFPFVCIFNSTYLEEKFFFEAGGGGEGM